MNGAAERIRYRKLPGHRRGFVRGASLWLGHDHLLSVRSMRVREEYKRFHLRDVQAIAVARAPRFHISTRSLLVGGLWLLAYLFLRNRGPWAPAVLWTAALCLVGAWLYVSSLCSCRCRIYTAVSADELTSVYRTWTARRLLAQLGPRILELQGVLEGNWAEALEGKNIGPGYNAGAVSAGGPPSTRPPAPRTRNVVTDIFLATLFADALVNALTLHNSARVIAWVLFALNIAEVGGAILIFIQHYRKILRVGMQRLAIATLVTLGVLYYVRPLLAGIAAGMSHTQPAVVDATTIMQSVIFREVDTVATAILGIAGLIIILLSPDEPAESQVLTGGIT
jgi:hypothetical protein